MVKPHIRVYSFLSNTRSLDFATLSEIYIIAVFHIVSVRLGTPTFGLVIQNVHDGNNNIVMLHNIIASIEHYFARAIYRVYNII